MFLQSFAIPGSLPLGVLAGALFKLPLGLLLVSACSAIGAFNCYLLSQFIGKSLIHSVTTTTSPSRKKKSNKFSQRLEFLKGQLEKYRHSLFSYMILLRVTPIIPNWFINIAAPHVGVDGGVFFWGTFIGMSVHVLSGLLDRSCIVINHSSLNSQESRRYQCCISKQGKRLKSYPIYPKQRQ